MELAPIIVLHLYRSYLKQYTQSHSHVHSVQNSSPSQHRQRYTHLCCMQCATIYADYLQHWPLPHALAYYQRPLYDSFYLLGGENTHSSIWIECTPQCVAPRAPISIPHSGRPFAIADVSVPGCG